MTQVAAENKFSDIALIEKSIRAFSLLECLVLSGCPFVFKGGTALMLQMDSAKRLSIDVDIICAPGTNIEEFLQKHALEYGFGDVKLVERVSAHNIPKTHAKFFIRSLTLQTPKQNAFFWMCCLRMFIIKTLSAYQFKAVS
jgi:hypothetical protein